MTKFDRTNHKIIERAKNKIENYMIKMAKVATKKLQKKYKGKKVECECFDSYIDGEDYYFNDELLDIQAYLDIQGDHTIDVTFNYESCYGKGEAKPRTFHLYTVKEVKNLN